MLRICDLSDGERKEVKRRYLGGESPVLIERVFHLKYKSVVKYAHSHGWKRERDNKIVIQPVKQQKNTEEELEYKQNVEQEKLQSKYRHLKRLYDQAVKEKVAVDRLVEAATDAIQAADPVIPFVIENRDHDRGEHRVVSLLSDVHAGEVVSAAETHNLSSYDMDIFKERLEIWTNKVVDLVSLRRQRLYVPNLSLFMLGDIISGDIHDELSNTNDVSVVDQMVESAREISRSLLTLSGYFENIEVSGVVGNHGRMSRKPYFKRKQRSNWDYLVYQMIAMFLQKQKNVTFHIPESFWTVRDVLGTRFLLMHGDGNQSWSGFPWYGIERSIGKMRTMLGNDMPFDRVALGHYHDPVDTERWSVNGNFKGGDEFSIGKLYSSCRPSQTLLYVHPENGVVGTERIYLDKLNEHRVKLSNELWLKGDEWGFE